MPVNDKTEVADSDDDPQPEYGGMVIVAKPKKRHVSPRSMNAMLVGITRRNPDMRRISDSDASVDRGHRALGSNELDAQTSFGGSLNAILFGE